MRTVIAGIIRDEDLALADRLQTTCPELCGLNTFSLAALCRQLGINSQNVATGQVRERLINEVARQPELYAAG